MSISKRPHQQRFGLAMLAASSAIGLLAFTTPVSASPLDFSQKLLAPDGARDDLFGISVALDGDYALISSSWGDRNGSKIGSAYLFDVTSGEFLQKFITPDGNGFDRFGYSVALDGNYALIGAFADDDNGRKSGSAYLFDVTSGEFLQKFIAPDGAIFDRFGRSVALDGDYALIGSLDDDDNGVNSGSAYLFDVTSGEFLQKLLAPDGANGDWFGESVALDGNYALISSRGDDDNGDSSGSAYLFDVTSGEFLQKILAPDGSRYDQFGKSVALDGNYGLIGSSADDDNGSASGSAYLFDLTSGEFLQKFIAPDGASSNQFGWSVALDGGYGLISSFADDDNGSYSGSAYLFDVTNGDFLQKIIAPDGASNDLFGWSVALNGDYALIGSHGDDDNGSGSGSAYLFTLEETPEKVPEPSAVLGLLAIGTLGLVKRFSGKHS